MVAEIFRYDCSHIMLLLNDDDDDAKALPTGVPKDDAMKKGGWGGQNVSKSDGVILVCSLIFSQCRPLIISRVQCLLKIPIRNTGGERSKEERNKHGTKKN